MLFAELVIAKNQNFSDEFKKIYKRFRFCGFEDCFIEKMIEYEEAIIMTTKKEYTEYFIKLDIRLILKKGKGLLKMI